ncbi:MAG: hypothetical protein LBB54_00345, partial [Cellulomonadaceae bacterium]|nr:hypothetical protein [Cellulomonadaceae bacterium]
MTVASALMGMSRPLRGGKAVTLLATSGVAVVLAVAVLMFIGSVVGTPAIDHALYAHITVSLFVQRLASILLLVVAWNLALRKRSAWLITVILLTLSLAMRALPHPHALAFHVALIALQVYALVTLLVCRDHFRRPANRPSLRRALIVGLSAVALMVVVAVVGVIVAGHRMAGDATATWGTWPAALSHVFSVVFTTYEPMSVFDWVLTVALWACIAAAVVMVLRSAIYTRVTSPQEQARARELVLAYGQNPGSYLTLEDDKMLFFGHTVDGVIAYGIVGGVVVVNGDPI